MNAQTTNANTYTKNMTADVWFTFQKRADVEIIEVETVYVNGEKLMRATFTINS